MQITIEVDMEVVENAQGFSETYMMSEIIEQIFLKVFLLLGE
jgi:hypothetical protein